MTGIILPWADLIPAANVIMNTGLDEEDLLRDCPAITVDLLFVYFITMKMNALVQRMDRQ